MKSNGALWLGAVLTLVGFAAAALLYHSLPDALPVHWNIQGHADGYMTKPWGVFFYPGMIGVATLLALVLPLVSPRGFRIEPFARAFNLVMAMIIVFCAYMMAIVFAGGLGFHIAINRAVLAGIGVLLIGLGNIFGKVTKNFFIGIRTPWTLASDEVWLRTQRFGGWLFVIAGFCLFGAALLDQGLAAALVIISIAALAPVLYSFFLYRRLEHSKEP
jgi:immunity protein, SdpI family